MLSPKIQFPISNTDPTARTAEHRFFSWLAFAMLVVVVVGFLPSYLLVPMRGLPHGNRPLTPLLHVHALVAFAWCLLFVAQARLVATGRTGLHRRLGRFGLGLLVALTLLGPCVVLESAEVYGATPGDLAFVAVGLGNVLAYTAFFGGGLLARRRADLHKRLMVLGMVGMLSAPFGRLMEMPHHWNHVVGPAAFVVALAWWDRRSRGSVHPATLYGGPLILLWQLLPNAYADSAWWQSTAAWMVQAYAR